MRGRQDPVTEAVQQHFTPKELALCCGVIAGVRVWDAATAAGWAARVFAGDGAVVHGDARFTLRCALSADGTRAVVWTAADTAFAKEVREVLRTKRVFAHASIARLVAEDLGLGATQLRATQVNQPLCSAYAKANGVYARVVRGWMAPRSTHLSSTVLALLAADVVVLRLVFVRERQREPADTAGEIEHGVREARVRSLMAAAKTTAVAAAAAAAEGGPPGDKTEENAKVEEAAAVEPLFGENDGGPEVRVTRGVLVTGAAPKPGKYYLDPDFIAFCAYGWEKGMRVRAEEKAEEAAAAVAVKEEESGRESAAKRRRQEEAAVQGLMGAAATRAPPTSVQDLLLDES